MKCALLLWLLLCGIANCSIVTLPIQNRGQLARLAAQVSDPSHGSYLAHKTASELHELFAPSEDQIRRWYWRNNNNSTAALVAGRRWQVEDSSATRPRRSNQQVVHFSLGAQVIEVVVAATLAATYGFDARATLVHPLRIAIIDEGDQYLPSDLAAFQRLTGLVNATYTNINDENGLDSADGESTLDVQSVLMTAPKGTEIDFIYSGDGGFSSWCTYILNLPDSQWPDVVSLSWGLYNERVDTSLESCLQLLSVGGVSVVVASGDDGAYGPGNSQCAPSKGFIAPYPAASAYVTSVGATAIVSPGSVLFGSGTVAGVPMCNGNSIAQVCRAADIAPGLFYEEYQNDAFYCSSAAGQEVAVDYQNNGGFFSGGGFSSVFDMPDWQRYAVGNYTQLTQVPFPATSLWTPTRRGYPDVSMHGAGVIIVQNDALNSEGGTSLSAPLFAGLIGHLVDWYKTRYGTGPGFLNPMLYSMAHTFNDITAGTNNGTQNNASCPSGGFTAAPGWDAVTGLGTPNLAKLIAALVAANSSASDQISSSTPAPASSSADDHLWIIVAIVGGIITALSLLSFICCKFHVGSRSSRSVRTRR